MLGQNVIVTEALAYASGTADRNGAVLDMNGAGGCLIMVHSAAIHNDAVYSIKVQQDTVVGMSSAADLEGTGRTILGTADDTVCWIDIKPKERFIRLVVDNDTTNATAQSAVYIKYDLQGTVQMPVADADGETHYLPAEGTA